MRRCEWAPSTGAFEAKVIWCLLAWERCLSQLLAEVNLDRTARTRNYNHGDTLLVRWVAPMLAVTRTVWRQHCGR